MSLEQALEERRVADTDKPIPYIKLAEKYGVERTTLARRDQGKSASRETKASAQQLLTPHQEAGLVKYIEGLTIHHLPPTRSMVRGFCQCCCSALRYSDLPASPKLGLAPPQ
ncbi:hypothetical protein EJ07DRAFT_122588 [Lizonia empirigonia]|nr:hypothetical protein EJ07DRAFT_122588 [Lizonia empirigonia]